MRPRARSQDHCRRLVLAFPLLGHTGRVETVNANPLIGPMLAMVLITHVVWATMGIRRTRAVASGETHLSRFAVRGMDGIEPSAVRASDHYSNLFEMPVLFYVALLTAMQLGVQTVPMLALAWVYVVLRAAHAWVHLGRNVVRYRFYAFVSSTVTLILMWLVIAGSVLFG